MYDPLIDKQVASACDYPSSYWASTLTDTPSFSALTTDSQSDVVVIGAGYAGLSCALHLAQHGIGATVLEANKIAWGCSGRNGGFVLTGTGRLGLAQLQQRFGEQTGQAVFREYQLGVDAVSNLIDDLDIDCERQPPGYYKVAHSKRWVVPMQNQAKLLSQVLDAPIEWIDAHDLQQSHLGHAGAHGALRLGGNYGVNPLKLALGYANACQQQGAKIYQNSPVTSIERVGDGYLVHTPQAKIRAKHVVIASNGYTPKGFDVAVDNRALPVLSSIIVTQAFSAAELQQAGLFSTSVVMDTRALKYYYRRLPDGRVLFGGRGAISGKNADKAVFQLRLLQALKNAYPGLPNPRIDYAWSGWVSVSLDDLPRVYSKDNLHYSMGYCGSGVAFTVQAGKRIAERIAGTAKLDLPIYNSPLKPFPFSPFKRLGQWGYYHWGRFVDAL